MIRAQLQHITVMVNLFCRCVVFAIPLHGIRLANMPVISGCQVKFLQAANGDVVINFYDQHVDARRCSKCNVYLSSQNPNNNCGTCEWLARLLINAESLTIISSDVDAKST
jgi:hypothetical protein